MIGNAVDGCGIGDCVSVGVVVGSVVDGGTVGVGAVIDGGIAVGVGVSVGG